MIRAGDIVCMKMGRYHCLTVLVLPNGDRKAALYDKRFKAISYLLMRDNDNPCLPMLILSGPRFRKECEGISSCTIMKAALEVARFAGVRTSECPSPYPV